MSRPRTGEGTDLIRTVFDNLRGEIAEVSPNDETITRTLKRVRQFFPTDEQCAVLRYPSAKFFSMGDKWWGVALGICQEPEGCHRLWEDLVVVDIPEVQDLTQATDAFWEHVKGSGTFNSTYLFSLSRGRIGTGVKEFADEVLVQALRQHSMHRVSCNDHVFLDGIKTRRLRDVLRTYQADLPKRLALNLFEYMQNRSHVPVGVG